MAGGGGGWSEARSLSPLNGWLTSNRNPQRPPKATFHPCVGMVCAGEVVVSSPISRGIVSLSELLPCEDWLRVLNSHLYTSFLELVHGRFG